MAIAQVREVGAERQMPNNGEHGKMREMDQNETQYMRGDREPATSSVLISNSKYLNNPYYRDVYSQFALRRLGHDISETYLIPNMTRALSEVMDMGNLVELIAKEKLVKPEFAEFLDQRRVPEFKPEQMRHHADGTLGAAIRDFVEKSGMEIELVMKGQAARSDLEYLMKYRGLSHDIEHLVTGFGAHQAGEIALAFCNSTAIVHYFSPDLAHDLSLPLMFVGTAGVSRASLHYPVVMPTVFEALERGTRAGRMLKKPLFLVHWDDYLDWQLTDLAAHLGFERGPGEAWNWTQAAATG